MQPRRSEDSCPLYFRFELRSTDALQATARSISQASQGRQCSVMRGSYGPSKLLQSKILFDQSLAGPAIKRSVTRYAIGR